MSSFQKYNDIQFTNECSICGQDFIEDEDLIELCYDCFLKSEPAIIIIYLRTKNL